MKNDQQRYREMIRPVCTRRFSTKNTPEEIHDKLRMSKLESEPFVYILSSASPDELIFKPHRVGSWLSRILLPGNWYCILRRWTPEVI